MFVIIMFLWPFACVGAVWLLLLGFGAFVLFCLFLVGFEGLRGRKRIARATY